MQIQKSHLDANGNTVYPKGWIPMDPNSPTGLAQPQPGPAVTPPPTKPPAASSGGGDSKGRELQCPDCTGKQIVNRKEKEAKTLEHLFPKMPSGIRNFLADVIVLLGLDKVQDKKSLFDKNCPTCGGKGTIKDPTDRSKQIQATKQAAEAKKDQITKLEAKASPTTGGNRTTIVVGNEYLQVGLAYNDSPSYKVLKEKQLAPGGASVESKAVMSVKRKTNAVVGTNPMSTLGGNYNIQCGNKFSVRAGAQGIDLHTEGPLSIKSGITHITAPELTLGSSVGQTIIEGDHLQLNGKSIGITPSGGGKGQISLTGTLHTQGNIIAQGGAHIEGDLSFISATCPQKTDRARHSSSDVQTTGPATWGPAKIVQEALQDYQRIRMLRVVDAAGISISPREIINTISETTKLLFKSLPLEPIPTGIIQIGTPVLLTGACPCNQGGSAFGPLAMEVTTPIPLYNFPHHHVLPDLLHTHDMLVPNINIIDNDKAVRKQAKGKEAPAPVTASTGGKSPITAAIEAVRAILAAKLVN